MNPFIEEEDRSSLLLVVWPTLPSSWYVAFLMVWLIIAFLIVLLTIAFLMDICFSRMIHHYEHRPLIDPAVIMNDIIMTSS